MEQATFHDMAFRPGKLYFVDTESKQALVVHGKIAEMSIFSSLYEGTCIECKIYPENNPEKVNINHFPAMICTNISEDEIIEMIQKDLETD